MRKIILIAALATVGYVAQAQPGSGSPDATPTPFGFVELLIGAGALLGGKKLYDKRNKEI